MHNKLGFFPSTNYTMSLFLKILDYLKFWPVSKITGNGGWGWKNLVFIQWLCSTGGVIVVLQIDAFLKMKDERGNLSVRNNGKAAR